MMPLWPNPDAGKMYFWPPDISMRQLVEQLPLACEKCRGAVTNENGTVDPEGGSGTPPALPWGHMLKSRSKTSTLVTGS